MGLLQLAPTGTNHKADASGLGSIVEAATTAQTDPYLFPRGEGEVLACPKAEPCGTAFVDGEEIDRSVYYKPKGTIPYNEMGISTNETRF